MASRSWFVNRKGQATGPYQIQDLKTMTAQGELRGHDLVYNDKVGQWKKAADWDELKEIFAEPVTPVASPPPTAAAPTPSSPAPTASPSSSSAPDPSGQSVASAQTSAPSAATPPPTVSSPVAPTPSAAAPVVAAAASEAPRWIVLVREGNGKDAKFRQRGPYDTDQVKKLLVEGQIQSSDHIWKKGEPQWRPIHEIAEFHANALKLNQAAKAALSGVDEMPPYPTIEIQEQETRVVSPAPEKKVTPDFSPPSDPSVARPVSAPVSPLAAPSASSDPSPSISAGSVPDGPPPRSHSKKAPPPPRPAGEDTYSLLAELTVEGDRVRRRKPSFWGRMVPVFFIFLFIIFGVGIWATLQTDAPFNLRGTLGQTAKTEDENSVPEVELGAVSSRSAPRAPSRPQPAAKPPPKRQARVEPKPKPEPPREAPRPADNQSPGLRFNVRTGQLEIGAPFRKGETLRIRVEGRPGQILKLRGLVAKLEVKAMSDQFHKIPISQLRLPDGDFDVSVQWGSSRLQRKLAWGKDSKFSAKLAAHRKLLIYDRQVERKHILRAVRAFSTLVARAEKGTAAKTIARSLEDKTPREVRSARSSRYELIYVDEWEKLAAHWDRALLILRDGGRTPASVAELARVRREVSAMESKIRNQSFGF